LSGADGLISARRDVGSRRESAVGEGEPDLDGFGERFAREFCFFDFPALLPLTRA